MSGTARYETTDVSLRPYVVVVVEAWTEARENIVGRVTEDAITYAVPRYVNDLEWHLEKEGRIEVKCSYCVVQVVQWCVGVDVDSRQPARRPAL